MKKNTVPLKQWITYKKSLGILIISFTILVLIFYVYLSFQYHNTIPETELKTILRSIIWGGIVFLLSVHSLYFGMSYSPKRAFHHYDTLSVLADLFTKSPPKGTIFTGTYLYIVMIPAALISLYYIVIGCLMLVEYL